MSWRLEHWTAFDGVAAEWARIAESNYSDHPLLDVGLVTSALEYFADDNVHVITQRESGTIRCIGIVCKRRRGVWETFSPSQIPFTLLVANDPESTGETARSLIGALPGFVLLLGLKHFDESYMGGMHVLKFLDKIEYGQTMNVISTGEFNEYWSTRSKNLKKSIRRNERKLQSAFSCRMEVTSAASEMSDAIKSYGDVESAGWKGTHGSAVHIGNRQGKFYCSLLKGFSGFNGARVFQLIAGDSVIASRIAIIKNGVMVILKTTYDEYYSEFGPGRLLLKYVLKYAFEDESVNNIEFYTKATNDQLRWATSSRFTYHYNFYASSMIRSIAMRVRGR